MDANKKRELVGNEGKVILDMIRRLKRRGASGHLLKLISKTHPADMAWVFRHLKEDERTAVFDIIVHTDYVGEFLSELDDTLVVELVTGLEAQYVANVISKMASDDAVDLLEILPEELASSIREHMAKKDREEVEELLQYHPESAGGLMSPDFMCLDEELTVGDAINSIQKRSQEKEMVFYLYITHGETHLSGVLSLRELLMHPSDELLENIMNPHVISVNTDTDQGEVAHVVSQYNILAVPVVDTNYNLVGIVTVDDIIDVIREEATEDFLQMAGVGKDRDILLKSTKENAMIRAPWLFASWIGGVVSSFIIAGFSEELSHLIALAAFIPVVTGMGGNIATQSSTIVVRGIATGRVNMSEAYKLVFREMQVGLILGLAYGVFVGIVAFLGYSDTALLGVVVGLSVFISMVMAATLGTLIPLILKRFDVDAAVATGPFVTTSIDLLGVVSYFFIAKLFLGL
ncbi:magnesium transporter [Desulfotalea psychrophila]|uniref:Magnesium transporter MgtE n=1 Tax=Desulfotalea psychrophila (strain LSv54 / DSM 12343) TaxID=177439 RepID=Q6AK57_DESPS|nr:magnesium transporter [Desulfotalea psychrophila]CAG37269.1 related to magnesium (Mg2+) transporter [Desulfotalea psychrophila LSv54]